MFQAVGESVHAIDLRALFQEKEESMQLYYKTDHHWTTDAAYLAYKELASVMDLAVDDDYE